MFWSSNIQYYVRLLSKWWKWSPYTTPIFPILTNVESLLNAIGNQQLTDLQLHVHTLINADDDDKSAYNSMIVICN